MTSQIAVPGALIAVGGTVATVGNPLVGGLLMGAGLGWAARNQDDRDE